MNFSVLVSVVSSVPRRMWVMPRRWSSIAHEKSSSGYTRNFLPILAWGRSEIRNMIRSRKAGSESCMSVFSLTHIEPSLARNISSHRLNWSSAGNCRQLHSIPSALFFRISSCSQSHMYM